MVNNKVVHGRIKGEGLTGDIVPTVELISSTSNPIETIFSVWHNSRHTMSILPKDIISVREEYKSDDISEFSQLVMDEVSSSYPEYLDGSTFESKLDEFEHIIKQVVILAIKCDVQASEFISYEFQVSDGSVAWREQLLQTSTIAAYLQLLFNLTSMVQNVEERRHLFGTLLDFENRDQHQIKLHL